MKKLIVTIAAVMVSLSAYSAEVAQALFATRVAPDLDAKVMKPDGTAPGPGFTAQMYIVKGDGSLDPFTPTTTFRTGGSANNPYWLVNTTVNAPASYAPGQDVSVKFRVWDGAGYGQDQAATFYGESQPVSYKLGGGTITPPNPTWGGFTLIPVPEPSTIALAVLGGVALLFRRRK